MPPSVVESALQKRKTITVVHFPLFIGTSQRLPTATASPPLLFAAGSSNHNIDNINDQSTTTTSISSNKRKLTHADIEWKLRPYNNNDDNNTIFTRLKIKSSATLLRIYSKLSGKKLPPVLCPKGGRAVLEAYYRNDNHDPTTPSTAKQEEEVVGKKKKNVLLRRLFNRRSNKKQMIAKFGFTTSRGPSNTEIDTTIRTIYNINPPSSNVATIAAIIYMYVEPQYRQCNVGSLALQVISAIQSVQAVDFTILVASSGDDDTLVEWYERRGYSRAPLLQDMMGSPNGEYGVAMIAPVHVRDGFFDECRVKWW